METDLNKIASLSKFNQDENWEFRIFLKGFDVQEIDSIVHEINQQVSSKIDCISCGNCCKIIQPVLNDKDIDQLSKSLKVKMKLITKEFEEQFKDYPLYSQESESDPLVICKLFDPCGSAT